MFMKMKLKVPTAQGEMRDPKLLYRYSYATTMIFILSNIDIFQRLKHVVKFSKCLKTHLWVLTLENIEHKHKSYFKSRNFNDYGIVFFHIYILSQALRQA